MPLTKVPALRKRQLPSGKWTYFADFTVDGKRKRLTLGPRKDLAEKQVSKIFNDLQNQQAGLKPKPPAMSLKALVDAFLQGLDGHVSIATIRRYRIYARHLVDFFVTHLPTVKTIDQITKAHLDECITALRKEPGKATAKNKSTRTIQRGTSPQQPKTLNGQIQFTKALFNEAVTEGWLPSSPAVRLKAFKGPKDKTQPYWTKDEVKSILGRAEAGWRDLFEFLYHTGLRKGELIHLTWDDVHLDTNPPSISICAKADWRPKTKQIRNVPLNQRAIDILQRQPKSAKHPYVFSGPKGAMVDEDRIYQALQRTLKKVGLVGDVHRWRHTFASHLVMDGVGIENVSKLLGHASIEMTKKYAHLAPYHLKQVVDRLTGLIDP
ncbi:MAG: tyrosine-type recombinase/integrase [bacterium]|nr:tyrosine-type recombinase/integrase [bacterium]